MFDRNSIDKPEKYQRYFLMDVKTNTFLGEHMYGWYASVVEAKLHWSLKGAKAARTRWYSCNNGDYITERDIAVVSVFIDSYYYTVLVESPKQVLLNSIKEKQQ